MTNRTLKETPFDVFKKTTTILTIHQYKPVSPSKILRTTESLNFTKDFFHPENERVEVFMKKIATYSIYVTIRSSGPKKIKRGFVRLLVIDNNKNLAIPCREIARTNNFRVEKIETYEKLLSNIPICPHCEQPMSFIQKDHYLCKNIKSHNGGKMIMCDFISRRPKPMGTKSQSGTTTPYKERQGRFCVYK